MLWEGKTSMSDQSRKINEETHSAPGKRLEKKTKPVLTPAQAKKKKEKTIMIVMIVLAVVMVIAAATVLFFNRWFKEPELPGPGPGQSASPNQSGAPAVETGEPTLDFDAVEPKVGGERKSKQIFTVLIFGSDTTSGLTDTMMVATYDVTNQHATVMSIPRDTLINSSARPSIDAKKLNAVYNVYGQGDKGIEALRNEVSELVGFVPDYYVQIDWELVGEMVDAIGGVWFDVPRHMEYYDPFQDLNIYQEKGYRFLDGDDAMQIVRFRHSNDGTAISDIERLNIQHDFLKAVLKQTLQIQNLLRIGQLIDLFNSRVNSDLDVENMFWFAQQAVMGGLQVDNVEFCTMPNALGSYGGRGFVYPIQGELLTLINQSLNPYKEQVTIRQLDLMSPTGDGGLRSSTGRLAEPSLAYPPVVATDGPDESDPIESGGPNESDPVGSDPLESGPVGADPIPAQTDDPPPAGPSAGPDVPVGPVSDPDPVDTGTGGGDTDVTDWGNTPE